MLVYLSVAEQIEQNGFTKGGSAVDASLLLYASSPSHLPGHRRVIHIDYVSISLPNGLRWASERNSRVMEEV